MRFLDLPQRLAEPLTARYVILPAPYEKTVSYGTGTGKAPAAILRASRQVEWYDDEVQRETCAAGIHTEPALRFPGPNQRRHIAVIGRAVQRFLARGQFVVTLGGEHTITVGAVEPYLARFSRLSLLHIDAHADLRDSYGGSRLSHAAVMRRFVGRCPFVSVGVCSLCPA